MKFTEVMISNTIITDINFMGYSAILLDGMIVREMLASAQSGKMMIHLRRADFLNFQRHHQRSLTESNDIAVDEKINGMRQCFYAVQCHLILFKTAMIALKFDKI